MSNTPDPTEPARSKVLRDRVGSSGRAVERGTTKATSYLAGSVSFLQERAIDRLFATSERVTSAAEGRAILASDESSEAVADRAQRLLVLAVPVFRMVARGARLTRVPWVLLGSTAFTSGLAVRTGAREVQVLSSLLAHRIAEATGQPADPAFVKKLAVELYLAPKRLPTLSDRRLRLGRLLRRWALRGAFGRATGKSATKALEAAEDLDLRPLIVRWAALGAPSSASELVDQDPRSGQGARGPTPPT